MNSLKLFRISLAGLPRLLWFLGLCAAVSSFAVFKAKAQTTSSRPTTTQQQGASSDTGNDYSPVEPFKGAFSPGSVHADSENIRTYAVLAFGLIIFGMQLYLLRGVSDLQAQDVARNFAVTLLLVGGLIIATGSYSTDDLAPIIGLFGTVAGYLLGQADKRPSPPASDSTTSTLKQGP